MNDLIHGSEMRLEKATPDTILGCLNAEINYFEEYLNRDESDPFKYDGWLFFCKSLKRDLISGDKTGEEICMILQNTGEIGENEFVPITFEKENDK